MIGRFSRRAPSRLAAVAPKARVAGWAVPAGSGSRCRSPKSALTAEFDGFLGLMG